MWRGVHWIFEFKDAYKNSQTWEGENNFEEIKRHLFVLWRSKKKRRKNMLEKNLSTCADLYYHRYEIDMVVYLDEDDGKVWDESRDEGEG